MMSFEVETLGSLVHKTLGRVPEQASPLAGPQPAGLPTPPLVLPPTPPPAQPPPRKKQLFYRFELFTPDCYSLRSAQLRHVPHAQYA